MEVGAVEYGKNLFNKNAVVSGYVNSYGGDVREHETYTASEFISINAVTPITATKSNMPTQDINFSFFIKMIHKALASGVFLGYNIPVYARAISVHPNQ